MSFIDMPTQYRVGMSVFQSIVQRLLGCPRQPFLV